MSGKDMRSCVQGLFISNTLRFQGHWKCTLGFTSCNFLLIIHCLYFIGLVCEVFKANATENNLYASVSLTVRNKRDSNYHLPLIFVCVWQEVHSFMTQHFQSCGKLWTFHAWKFGSALGVQTNPKLWQMFQQVLVPKKIW